MLLEASFPWAPSILICCLGFLALLIYSIASLPHAFSWQLFLLTFSLMKPGSNSVALLLGHPCCACVLHILSLLEAAPQMLFTVWSAILLREF